MLSVEGGRGSGQFITVYHKGGGVSQRPQKVSHNIRTAPYIHTLNMNSLKTSRRRWNDNLWVSDTIIFTMHWPKQIKLDIKVYNTFSGFFLYAFFLHVKKKIYDSCCFQQLSAMFSTGHLLLWHKTNLKYIEEK